MKNFILHYIKAGLLLVLLIMGTLACNKNPLHVNVSGKEITIPITRFEQMLFSADPSSIEKLVPQWKKEFGTFLRHYSYITKLGNIDDPDFSKRLSAFASDYYNYQIYNRTKQIFPDLNSLNSDLNGAFSHYHYYFPEKTIPTIITYISGFNQSAITDDTLLAIGLDKYLGKDEMLYKQLGIYNYLLGNMHPKKIVSDCMNFWGETEFPFHDSVNNLIVNMIYRGRLLYFTSAMLPEQPDSLKWGFSQNDLDYFVSAEKAMWAYLVENKLLFNSDKFTIDKFILEGPFTKDFGRGSPARASVWIGYRIIQSYLHRNPNLSLVQLMEEKDYMKILNQSGYNP